MNNSRHIASSGASAGQWVKCTAKKECPLGGIHIEENVFQASKLWLKEKKKTTKNLTDITKEDVEEFMKSPDRGNYQAKYLAEKFKVKDKTETRKPVRNRYDLTEETRKMLHEQANAARAQQAFEPKTMKYQQLSLNSVDSVLLKRKCAELDVKMSYDSVGSSYRGRITAVVYENLRFNGPGGKVDEVIAYADELKQNTIVVRSYENLSCSTDIWNRLQDQATFLNVDIEHSNGRVFRFQRRVAFPEVFFCGTAENTRKLHNWLAAQV